MCPSLDVICRVDHCDPHDRTSTSAYEPDIYSAPDTRMGRLWRTCNGRAYSRSLGEGCALLVARPRGPAPASPPANNVQNRTEAGAAFGQAPMAAEESHRPRRAGAQSACTVCYWFAHPMGTARNALIVDWARNCAVPLGHVVESMRPLPVDAVTGVPDFVRGLAIIRGSPTPVVDSSRPWWVRQTHPSGRSSPARLGGRTVALAVGSVLGVRDLEAALGPLPPLLQEASAAVVERIGTLDAQLLVVLRAGWLLPQTAWNASLRGRGRDRRPRRGRALPRVVGARLGLTFDDGKLDQLAQALRQRVEQTGAVAAAEYLGQLANGSRDELRAVAELGPPSARPTSCATPTSSARSSRSRCRTACVPAGRARGCACSPPAAPRARAYSMALLLRERAPELTAREVEVPRD